MTMRGFDEEDSRETGRIIAAALTEEPDLDALRANVDALCARRPLYPGFRGYSALPPVRWSGPHCPEFGGAAFLDSGGRWCGVE
jgi:hypothetical protein